MSERVVIIGGGMGGLSAAVRLAVGGARVTLLEKNDRLGGKCNRWDSAGFRFDTGPSLLTLPVVFEQLFAAAGESLADHVRLIRLDPISRFVWVDGMTFELRSDPSDTLDQVRRISPGDVDGWRRLYLRGQRIWDLTAELFLYRAPEQAIRAGGAMAGLGMATMPFRIGMFGRYSKLVDRHVRHPRLREVLYQYATYSGASPFKAPATLAVIPFAEQRFGGWYPAGGMYALVEAVADLARRRGVDIRTGVRVRRILSTARRVTGVETDRDERIDADAVLANSDVVYTYRSLVDPTDRPKYTDRKLDAIEPGGSGVVLLLGTKRTYPQLAHHTKFMPADYRSDLHAMFETKSVPDDPCIYVCASTRSDSTQAPAGHENLFVLCSAPATGSGIDWSTAGRSYRDKIVSTLENRRGMTGLGESIVAERWFTPTDLESTYHANAGSIYGIGSNSRRSAFLRPANRDTKLAGLFFAGGATHPGGGLPLVTLSGKIAAELILQSWGRKAPWADRPGE